MVGLADEVPGLHNIHVQIADSGGEITFLHTIAEGPCDDSYGVQVAGLAGLPTPVVERARDLLLFLESQAQGARAGEGGVPMQRETGQSSLFGWGRTPPTRIVEKESEIEARLSEVDPDMLSPRDAMDLIYELRGMLKESHEWLEE